MTYQFQHEPIAQAKLHCYRIPFYHAVLAELNQRSRVWGLAQTLGHLGRIMATGALSWYASQHWSWFVLAGCLLLHGTVYAFLLNAFHELCHTTVFKTRSLNRFFLYLVSFLGGLNHALFGRAIKSIITHLTQWRGFGRLRLPKIALLLTRQGVALPREQQAGCVEGCKPSKPPACVTLRKVRS